MIQLKAKQIQVTVWLIGDATMISWNHETSLYLTFKMDIKVRQIQKASFIVSFPTKMNIIVFKVTLTFLVNLRNNYIYEQFCGHVWVHFWEKSHDKRYLLKYSDLLKLHNHFFKQNLLLAIFIPGNQVRWTIFFIPDGGNCYWLLYHN